jgi:metacaspase-1
VRDDMTRMRAVLVGVDEYERPDVPSLRGCVNDVAVVRWLLKQYFGMPNSDIRVLVNQRATKANILHRLDWMLRDSEPGDVAVFYFSGHGSQIRDRDEDELADHLDEVLCPYDMDWDARTYILDDEFDAIAGPLAAEILLETFFDCCFWGGSQRGLLQQPATAPLRPDVRFLRPPPDIFARAEGEELAVRRVSNSLRRADGNVVWAASQEGEPSSEDYFDGRPHGVFTYWGCRFIADYIDREQRWDWPREDLFDALRQHLHELAYGQTPALAAPEDLLRDAALVPAAWMLPSRRATA